MYANTTPLDETLMLDIVSESTDYSDSRVTDICTALIDYDYTYNNEWCSSEYVQDVWHRYPDLLYGDYDEK